MSAIVYSLDLAHPAPAPAVVEQELEAAMGLVRRSEHLRVIKVIHGYGSTGRGGATRETVRNWAYRRRAHLRGVIEGERYEYSDPLTRELLLEIGSPGDPDLDARNPGITILWVR